MPYRRPVIWTVDHASNPVVKPGRIHGDLDAERASAAHVFDMGDHYRMYYWGTGTDGYNRILMARCPKDDLNNWAPMGSVLERQPDTDYDFQGPSFPNVVPVDENRWLMYFAGWGRTRDDGKLPNNTGLAVSEDGGMTFKHWSDRPMLATDRPWDREGTGSVYVVRDGGLFRMYYTAIGEYFEKPEGVETAHNGIIPRIGIGYALSEDGISWTKPLDRWIVGPRGFDAEPYEYIVSKPFVMRDGNGYRMWVNTCSPAYRIHCLSSPDGDDWRWIETSSDQEMGIGEPGGFDDHQRCYISIVRHENEYRCWYTGNGYGLTGIGYATGVLA